MWVDKVKYDEMTVDLEKYKSRALQLESENDMLKRTIKTAEKQLEDIGKERDAYQERLDIILSEGETADSLSLEDIYPNDTDYQDLCIRCNEQAATIRTLIRMLRV